jgi:5-formyltetrahydrofolate cyclo-ligase
MSVNSVEIKAALRRQLRERLQSLSAEERNEASAQIRQRLAGQPVWQKAQSVLFYVPTTSEPDLWPLAIEALGLGKQVALLRYSPNSDSYAPCLIREPSGDLLPGRFSIPEPAAHCLIFPSKQLDLALVPGIGFTLDGGRLGRGKGYYDRLLAEVPGFKCGVAFDCQVASEFPLEPHDVRLNCILTPTRWHLVTGQPRS